MEGALNSLGRIAKHLPNTTLDHLSRITVDARGKVWVTDDATVILLKGHLLIEAELVDICRRLLKDPEALEAGRVPFAVRLNLVRALAGEDAMPECIYQAFKDLNKIRNELAHKLEPTNFDKALQRLLGHLNPIDDIRTVLSEEKSVLERLNTFFIVMCGALSSIGKPADEEEEQC